MTEILVSASKQKDLLSDEVLVRVIGPVSGCEGESKEESLSYSSNMAEMSNRGGKPEGVSMELKDVGSSIDNSSYNTDGKKEFAIIPTRPPACDDAGVVITKFVKDAVKCIFDYLGVYGFEDEGEKGASSSKFQKAYFATCRFYQEGANACGGGDEGAMKFIKYKLASFKFFHTKQYDEPPPIPWKVPFKDNPKLLACGAAYSYVSDITRHDSPRKVEFVTGVPFLKKGMPRPSKRLVDKQVNKTRVALTKERDAPNPFTLECPSGVVEINRELIYEEATRTIRELFRGREYKDEHRHKMCMPSLSSTWSTKKVLGGGLKELWQDFHSYGFIDRSVEDDNMNFRPSEYQIRVRRNVMIPWPTHIIVDYPPDEYYHNVTDCHSYLEIRWNNDDREYIGKGKEVRWIYDSISEEKGEDIYNYLYEQMIHKEYIRCVPKGLQEALKVRVITKGEAEVNLFLHPLQKFLWRTLKNRRVFQLIGKPVDVNIINSMLGPLKEGYKFNSGDYSAATDNLDPWISNTICDLISDEIKLDPVERKIFKMALTGHLINVNDLPQGGTAHDMMYKPQKWGQLMGSIVSFPVLCIANFIVSRLALELGEPLMRNPKYLLVDRFHEFSTNYLSQFKEENRQANHHMAYNAYVKLVYGLNNPKKIMKEGLKLEKKILNIQCQPEFVRRKYHVNECPMLINGDDIAFQCNDLSYSFWKRITAFIGLETSIGKTYFSDEFVQINSTDFQYDASKEIPYIQTPYVNFGLLYGLKRSGECIEISEVLASQRESGLGARHRELLQFSNPALHLRIHELFLERHKYLLDNLRIPLYISESYGGLGLQPIKDAVDSMTIVENDGVPFINKYYKYGPSDLDMRCLSAHLADPKEFKLRKASPLQFAKFHNIAMDKALQHASLSYNYNDHDEELYQELYNEMILDVFYSDQDLESSIKKIKQRRFISEKVELKNRNGEVKTIRYGKNKGKAMMAERIRHTKKNERWSNDKCSDYCREIIRERQENPSETFEQQCENYENECMEEWDHLREECDEVRPLYLDLDLQCGCQSELNDEDRERLDGCFYLPKPFRFNYIDPSDSSRCNEQPCGVDPSGLFYQGEAWECLQHNNRSWVALRKHIENSEPYQPTSIDWYEMPKSEKAIILTDLPAQ